MLRTIVLGVAGVGLGLSVLAAGGCSDQDYMNPTALGRFRPTPVVNVILDSLGVGEEEPSPYANAEEPRPADLMLFDEDYTIGPGDTLRISIFELLQQGLTDIRDYVVTESGNVSIPEVGSVHAAGLTERQLESELKRILSPAILRQPSVTISVQSSENRVFSINGDGVNRPGRYAMPRSGLRLSEALATAGSVGQFNVSYIYVTRDITGKEGVPEQQSSANTWVPGQSKRTGDVVRNHIVLATDMISEDELRSLAAPGGAANGMGAREPLEQVGKPANPAVQPEKDRGRIEWVFRDGQWIPVQAEAPVSAAPPSMEVSKEARPEAPEAKPEAETPPSFGWEQIGGAGVQTRLIKIPVKKLMSGDSRYDIVIRAGDKITVPLDIVGEFCVYGNVNQVGYVPLTGRPMTLTGAIAAAGGLGPLAWPENVEVRRRIDENHEAIVQVNLRRIAEGTQPDFFIKPHDIINVGTHPSARWLAILRTAFRATYGFGFIYDRNFADRDYQRPISIF